MKIKFKPEKFEEVRITAGIPNQTEAAKILGVGQPAFSRKVEGKAPVSINELIKFCEYFNISINEFFEQEGGPEWEGEASSKEDLMRDIEFYKEQIRWLRERVEWYEQIISDIRGEDRAPLSKSRGNKGEG